MGVMDTPWLEGGLGGLFFDGEIPDNEARCCCVGGGMIGLEDWSEVAGGGGEEFKCLAGGLYASGCVMEGREVWTCPFGVVPLEYVRAPRFGVPCVGDIEGRFFIGDGRF